MSEAELWALLTPMQVQKHQEVLRYLSLDAPNVWLTAPELDQRLPFGAQLARFPPEYWTKLNGAHQGVHGLQVQLSPSPAVQFRSVTFSSVAELLGTLPAFADDCVGVNTRVVHNTPATQLAIRDAIRQRQVYFVPNQPGRGQCGFTAARTGSVARTAEDSESGEGGGSMIGLDGGSGELIKWQLRAPLGIVGSEHVTRRRVKETSASRAFPTTLEQGERLKITIQRQDCHDAKPIADGQRYVVPNSTPRPHPRGWAPGIRLVCRMDVDGTFAGDAGDAGDAKGIIVDPPTVHFSEDGCKADINVQAVRAGSYFLKFNVQASAPEGHPPGPRPDLPQNDTEAGVRITVLQAFPYTHSMNTLTKENEAANSNPRAVVVPAGGVVLYGVDKTCPLALPPEHLLDVFSTKANPYPTGGKVVPVGSWWCDPSPHLVLDSHTQRSAQTDELAALTSCGYLVDRDGVSDKAALSPPNVPTRKPAALQAAMQPKRDRAAEMRDILQREAALTARKVTEEVAAKKKRMRKSRLSRDLCNKHMLNHGINLLKPFREKTH